MSKEKEVLIRVPVKLLDEFKNRHPELEGLGYSAVAEVMLRKSLKLEDSKGDEKND